MIIPTGFTTTKHVKRAKKVEWEHVVPAEIFGRTFTEWRDGNKKCVDKRGKLNLLLNLVDVLLEPINIWSERIHAIR